MSSRIAEVFDAIVAGVTPHGTFVRVLKPAVEGLLAQGQQGADVGDRLRAKRISTDVQRGYIDFARTKRGWPLAGYPVIVKMSCFRIVFTYRVQVLNALHKVSKGSKRRSVFGWRKTRKVYLRSAGKSPIPGYSLTVSLWPRSLLFRSSPRTAVSLWVKWTTRSLWIQSSASACRTRSNAVRVTDFFNLERVKSALRFLLFFPTGENSARGT